jgi:signal transduction histidine kinase/DNA-binding response OmpR family regulator/ligand-binding sensor domain-containing protein
MVYSLIRTWAFTFSILFLGSISLNSQNAEYTIERITVENGLSHNSVLGIARDQYGFMWFSTFAGLNRYDGYTIKQYLNWQPNGAYSGLNLRDVVCGKQNELWVSDQWVQVFKYNFQTDSFHYIPQNQNTSPVQQRKAFVDSKGNYWLLNYRGFSFSPATDGTPTIYHHTIWNQPKINESELYCFHEDWQGNIWIGGNGYIYKFRIQKNDTLAFKYAFRDSITDGSAVITSMYADRNGNLWLARMNGVKRIKISDLDENVQVQKIPGKAFQYVYNNHVYSADVPAGSEITAMQSDNADLLYLRTNRGIDVLNTKTEKIFHITDEGAFVNYDADQGENYSAFCYTPDGILWVGTEKGVLKITRNKNVFNSLDQQLVNPELINTKRLKNVYMDSRGRPWIGTVMDGIIVGTQRTGNNRILLKQYTNKVGDPVSLNFNGINCISETPNGNIWIGSEHFQLAVHRKNGWIFQNLAKDRDPATASVFNGIFPYSVKLIGDKIWVCADGIFIYDTLSWERKDFFLNSKKIPLLWAQMVKAPDGNWYIMELQGIHKITLPLRQLDSEGFIPTGIETYTDSSEYYGGKRSFLITEKNGELQFWLSSVTAGLTRYKLEKTRDYNKRGEQNSPLQLVPDDYWNVQKGLCNNTVLDLLQDSKKRIWISTRNGLARLDPETGSLQNFYESDGLPCDKLYWGACSDAAGYMYFCSNKGLISFHPDSIWYNEIQPGIYITGFQLFGKEVKPGKGSPLEKVIYMTDQIQLRYNQNFISLEYVALNYINTARNRYKYKLEGLNDDWIDAGERRFAEYQDLKPGHYTFRVIGSNDDGVWNMEGASLEIIITPPFWQRAWFIGSVLLLMIAGIVWYIKRREKNLRLRNLWLEKEVGDRTAQALEHQQELEHMKSRFYTNISHEFRTPLTIINGSTDELAKLIPESRANGFLHTIRKASSHLLKLVNELLDLARIEAGNLRIQVSEGNLSETAKLVWQIYLSEADRKKIQINFRSDPETIIGWFDPSSLEKILHNLVSNALKFTDTGGRIDISLQRTDPFTCRLSVLDIGRGIPPEKLNRIFDRFYQVESSDSRSGEGTGIGLALVKELVQRHHGTVAANSHPGMGTEFLVSLPLNREAYSTEELSEVPEAEQSVSAGTQKGKIIPEEPVGGSGDKNFRVDPEKPLILVAEDNTDLLAYIAGLLSKDYRVLEAAEGKSALEKASEFLPELIITDIMMPVMDGIELCRNIKDHGLTCHIPVIMLTAKADIASKLEGLKTGADDYLMKPFEPEELLVRSVNLIEQRRRLRKKFSGTATLAAAEYTSNPKDESLLQKAVALVEENLSDSEYSVQELIRDLGLSQRTAQRKLKALTGLAPNEFIRTIRIKYAARMITGKRESISQIAYGTGFNNLSYFTKSFHEVFGVNPSEYKG